MRKRISSVSVFLATVLASCSSKDSVQLPSLSTAEISQIQGTRAVSGGTITSDGGGNISARGIVWGPTGYPTVDYNHGYTNDGTGTGSFTSNLTGLLFTKGYYVRAYAINEAGIAYGNELSFSTSAWDIITNPGAGVIFDGYPYKSVILGNGQEWLIENLRTSKYCNGDIIPNVTDSNQWVALTSGAWAHYNNDSQHETPYGKLYNWFAVNDSRNICPCGWHIPSDDEWTLLTDYLGGEEVAGAKMKSTGFQYWQNPSGVPHHGEGTNESGFCGLPGGSSGFHVAFTNIGIYGYWWSSTVYGNLNAYLRTLSLQKRVIRWNGDKRLGLSVRCIKD